MTAADILYSLLAVEGCSRMGLANILLYFFFFVVNRMFSNLWNSVFEMSACTACTMRLQIYHRYGG